MALSPRGRGWPALRPRAPCGLQSPLGDGGLRAEGRAGAFTRRGGPGEGSGIRCRIYETTYLATEIAGRMQAVSSCSTSED